MVLWRSSCFSLTGIRSCVVTPSSQVTFTVGDHDLVVTNVFIANEPQSDSRSTLLIHHANKFKSMSDKSRTCSAALTSLNLEWYVISLSLLLSVCDSSSSQSMSPPLSMWYLRERNTSVLRWMAISVL